MPASEAEGVPEAAEEEEAEAGLAGDSSWEAEPEEKAEAGPDDESLQKLAEIEEGEGEEDEDKDD